MSNLSGDPIEKHELFYTSAHLEEAMILGCHDECCDEDGDQFTDEDMQ